MMPRDGSLLRADPPRRRWLETWQDRADALGLILLASVFLWLLLGGLWALAT